MSAILDNGPIHHSEPEFQQDEIDLGEMLDVILSSKCLIVGATLAVFSLGAAYAFVATPMYEADALLQVEEKQSGFGTLELDALLGAEAPVVAEIEILRSRSVLGGVVDNLKLDIIARPQLFPMVGAALARRVEPAARQSIQVDTLDVPFELLGKRLTLVAGRPGSYQLFGPEDELLLDGAVGQSADNQLPGQEALTIFVSEMNAEQGQAFILQRLSRLAAISRLQAALRVSEKGRASGILEIQLEGDNALDVSNQVNEIANIYVRNNVEQQSAEAQKTLTFLEEQLPIVEQDMEVAEVALNTYRLEKGSVDLPLETQSILSTVVEVEGQLNALEQEHDQITQRFTPAHPMVIALDKQIQRLISELGDLNDRVKDLPATQQEVLRLFRDVQVNTELYTALLNAAQELRVVKAGTIGNVRVVDHAVPRYEAVRPKTPLILALSLLLGAGLGVMIAFLIRALSKEVEDPELIEQQIGIPVYAVIAHSQPQDKLLKNVRNGTASSGVLAVAEREDSSIESLRNLRTMLHFGMVSANNNIILITGPSPAVGKSFISVNLAAVLASTGKKVLVIDADLRKGHLHQYLGLKRENGLSDFICGRIEIGKAVHKTAIKGLDIIPSGILPPNPAELLLHKRFSNSLNVLVPHYDHIIVDSPPVLAVTDACIIGQLAGATLMVVKAGAHPMREIEQCAKRLQHAGVNLRGVLFNDVDISSRRYGAGRYSYQYAYKK